MMYAILNMFWILFYYLENAFIKCVDRVCFWWLIYLIFQKVVIRWFCLFLFLNWKKYLIFWEKKKTYLIFNVIPFVIISFIDFENSFKISKLSFCFIFVYLSKRQKSIFNNWKIQIHWKWMKRKKTDLEDDRISKKCFNWIYN